MCCIFKRRTVFGIWRGKLFISLDCIVLFVLYCIQYQYSVLLFLLFLTLSSREIIFVHKLVVEIHFFLNLKKARAEIL